LKMLLLFDVYFTVIGEETRFPFVVQGCNIESLHLGGCQVRIMSRIVFYGSLFCFD
jgi:hypothetical protein